MKLMIMGEAADILDRYHLKKLRAKLDEILIVGSTYPGGGFLMNNLLPVLLFRLWFQLTGNIIQSKIGKKKGNSSATKALSREGKT